MATATETEITTHRSSLLRSEDWWAVWLGLFIFALGAGRIWNLDILGWVTKFGVWIDPTTSIAANSKSFAWLGGIGSVIATYVFTLVITSIGAHFMGNKVKKFALGFTVIYWIMILTNILGNYAYLAATPNKREAFHIGWSLSLGELGFVFALIAGLIIGNFFPKVTKFLSDAAKPEWYIKTGIVILGMNIGIQTISAMNLASTVIIRGMCAVVEAYLIYWPIVYFIARKFFKFTPEWAAPMASGISICGVAAAIATGSAIRARQIIPTILASVIIVFVAVELLILPFAAAYFLPSEPMVAGSWLGLVVKSDGGAVASGAIADTLIRNNALQQFGVNYQEGWILMATTTSKVFIDVFIGVWSFILAIVWSVYHLNSRSAAAAASGSDKVSKREIWERFPKFIIGFVAALVIIFLAGYTNPDIVANAKAGAGQANLLRAIFFGLCFFSIGLVTNVRKLWNAGLGRVVGVYAVALLGFIIWVGLFISYIFYHGIVPPTI
ncbi:putative sulfate exporter family transporter [uncultured Megasphaera sp.]|uniref:putative sulfate exporter family transporter n=1 Tax=uncultured Megasphaera sp. TaxID=165188 RepID=UPI002657EBBF|nr:putative sulfate exporter family transporter [uncultured Megasphaera sp.]